MKTANDLTNSAYGYDDFVFFWKHNPARKGYIGKECLSQWYKAPMEIDGRIYNCVEQYLMAEKARVFKNYEVESEIMKESSQMKIKRLGRKVKNYDNKVWAKIRQKVAIKGNMAKFTQNPALMAFMLSTGNKILVEASPRDTIWGIGLEESSPDALIPARWKGSNLLGFALMEVRERISQL